MTTKKVLHLYKNKKNRKGFSMIEAAIAIFICGLTLVVFLSVFAPVLKLEFYERDQIMAASLAQEGVEIIRNIRDNNLKGQNPGRVKNAFDAPFPATTGSTNGAGCLTINFNYKYKYTGGPQLTLNPSPCNTDDYATVAINKPEDPPTQFERLIGISGTGDSRTVTSRVRWKPKGSDTYSYVTVTDTLYAWGNRDN